MSDYIKKLYKLAGIEDYSIKNLRGFIPNGYKCIADENNKVLDIVIDFTAEKQLELIKWIAHKANNGLLINKHITDGGASMVFDNLGYESTLASSFISFEECLAKLVNNLWQDLAEKQKQEIKRILE